MRRRSRFLNESPPPSRLFLNDLERIHRILREGHDDPVAITSGPYECDEPAQLAELGERVREVEMEVHAHGAIISFELHEGGELRLYASEDSGEPARKVRDIGEVIQPRRRPMAGVLFARPTFTRPLVLVAIGFGLILSSRAFEEGTALALSIGGLVIAMLAPALPFVGLLWGGSVIHTFPLGERPGWWKRNRDQLLVGLIAAVAAFLLGLFVD